MLRVRLGVVLSLIAVSTVHGQAQRGTQLWYQAYESGVRDVGRGAWDSAVQNLQAAERGGPKPARRVVFYGDRVDAFNPDYYLGVAYLNLRRFADADAAFERVRQASLITTNDSQFRVFQTQAATAKFELILGQAEDYLTKGDFERATQASNQAAGLGVDAARARAFQQRLAEAQPAPAALTPVPPTPAGGTPAVPPPGPPPPGPPPPVPPVVPVPAGPPVAPPANPPSPPGRGPQPGTPRVVQTGTPAQAAPAGVRLEIGIAAYLAGRYGDAASLLTVAATSNPQGSARARFYLACSLAALVLSGEREESDLVNAKAALQAAGRLDQFAPDRRIISPRVLAALGIQQ